MNYLLFTTSQCPKCPVFKKYIAENVKFQGENLDEQSSDFMDKAREHSVTQAPTIIVFENKKEIFRADDISILEGFLSKL